MAIRPFTYIDFAQEPIATQTAVDCTAVAAGDNENTLHRFMNGILESNTSGSLATDLPIFTKDTQGHSIVALSGDAIGIEFTHGVLSTSHMEFTIGTSPAFFVELEFDIPTVSEYDVAAVGFRAQAAYGDLTADTTMNAYTDIAYLSCNEGNIVIGTELNNGDITETDTTDNWADGDQVKLRVNVSAAGVITFQHDNATSGTLAAPTAVATQTFDTGDVVIPFMAFVATGDTDASPIILVQYACGYQ